jgi:RND family efflux transporter MFP subunit
VKRPIQVALLIGAILTALLITGYLPRRARDRNLVQAAGEAASGVPQVTVARVQKAASTTDLVLPGNITPITEAILNARASGYVRRRLVDIGDRVTKGQLLAELEAPELDQQVGQAQASVAQAKSVLAGAQDNLSQVRARLKLSQVTADRWKTLVQKGVVSRQESDQKDADLELQQATVRSAQSAIRAAEDSVRASEANLSRLREMQSFLRITAPFDGIITVRNIDIGALISAGSGSPLFKIAQTGVLRITLDVPQSNAPFIKVGMSAEVTLQELPGRTFRGRVARTANALDLSTRTLPTEVQVDNQGGVLMPNMFAQVKLQQVGTTPMVLIPGDALIVRQAGTMVAVVDQGRVRFQKVDVGRDNGAITEVRSGLQGDELVVVNPTDDVREGAQVKPVIENAPAAPATRH